MNEEENKPVDNGSGTDVVLTLIGLAAVGYMIYVAVNFLA